MFNNYLLNDGNKIMISSSDNLISIVKIYLNQGMNYKFFNLAIWNNEAVLYGYTDDLKFEISEEDPLYDLYIPLLNNINGINYNINDNIIYIYLPDNNFRINFKQNDSVEYFFYKAKEILEDNKNIKSLLL